MNDVDKRAIELLACADTYHGPQRQAAVEAWGRGLRNGEHRKSVHMDFMAEVVAPIPDLLLRSTYRKKVAALCALPR